MRRSTIKRRARRTDPVLGPMKRTWGQEARKGLCAVCGASRYLSGHHIVPLQSLRAEGVPKELWYDLDNQLVLCTDPAPNRCHDHHERWIKRIPRELIPQRAELFAESLGLGWLLDREYPMDMEEAA